MASKARVNGPMRKVIQGIDHSPLNPAYQEVVFYLPDELCGKGNIESERRSSNEGRVTAEVKTLIAPGHRGSLGSANLRRDFYSILYKGILFPNKLSEDFSKFRLPKYRYFPMTVHSKCKVES